MCGPHFCSMKISQDVRKYAAENELVARGRARRGDARAKSEEFLDHGSRVYLPVVEAETVGDGIGALDPTS